MGKPKKTVEDKRSLKPILGTRVKYMGLGSGTEKSCKQCGSTKRKAMFSVYENEYYCNEYCIRASVGS